PDKTKMADSARPSRAADRPVKKHTPAPPVSGVDVTVPQTSAGLPAKGKTQVPMRPSRRRGNSNFRPISAGPSRYPTGRITERMASAASPEVVTALSSAAQRAQWQSRPVRHVNVRVTGASGGFSPLYVAFNTDLPAEMINGADFLWTHNGAPLCDTSRGAKILQSPGEHTLAVLIITRDGQEYRGSTTIDVRDRRRASRPS
ncbi:MAG: hypothetical protein V3T70_00690, partial [Phycisphaerae bacterium]